jgi:hypothetical protein
MWPTVTIRCINCRVDKLWNVNPLTCTSKWTLFVSVQDAVYLCYTETNTIISWTNFHRVNDRNNNRWCRSILTNDPHSPTCKANSYSARKGCTWLLMQRKVRYRVHNRPPLVPSLGQKNPVHTHNNLLNNNQFALFKIMDDPNCVCKMGPQTTDHLLWECELLSKQRKVLKNIITKAGGYWPLTNSDLENKHTKLFQMFVNSINFETLWLVKSTILIVVQE